MSDDAGNAERALDEARAAIDSVDDRILALLAERSALAARVAAAKPASGMPLRPAREAQMVRRLMEKAGESVSGSLVVEVWRALIADNVRRQAPFEVFCGGGTDPVRLFDLARRHFGASIRISRSESAAAALTRMLETPGSVTVAPFPGDSGAGTWWPVLSESRFQGVTIIGALPWRAAEGEPLGVVCANGAALAPAGQDRTLAFGLDQHRKIVRALNLAGLEGRELLRSDAKVLVGFDSFIAPDDPRVARAQAAGLDRLRVIGAYARL